VKVGILIKRAFYVLLTTAFRNNKRKRIFKSFSNSLSGDRGWLLFFGI